MLTQNVISKLLLEHMKCADPQKGFSDAWYDLKTLEEVAFRSPVARDFADIVPVLNKLTSLPMCGFIAQLVEHRTGIAEVTGSNPVEALIFSGFSFPIA